MIERHPLTGEWVILAPWRGQRPNAFEAPTRRTPTDPRDCPFCPGNEEQTPPEIMRRENTTGWRVRVVPNRYPAIDHHEVVIESPQHAAGFGDLAPDHAATVLETYASRYRALSADPTLRHISIFKNDGEGSGQSIDHLHSQIVGLPVVPPRAELISAAFERQPCLLCMESGSGNPGGKGDASRRLYTEDLILKRTAEFILLVPPIPLFPFETWLVPVAHAPNFLGSQPDKLAALMQTTVLALNRALDSPSINLIFHNSPLPVRSRFHWFLQVFPRLTLQGGFELGSGMQINVVDPGEAASRLREAIS